MIYFPNNSASQHIGMTSSRLAPTTEHQAIINNGFANQFMKESASATLINGFINLAPQPLPIFFNNGLPIAIAADDERIAQRRAAIYANRIGHIFQIYNLNFHSSSFRELIIQ